MLKNKLCNCLVALASTFALTINMSFLYQQTKIDFRIFRIDMIFIALLILLFYFLYQKRPKRKLFFLQHAFALLLGIFMVVGNSFHQIGSGAFLYAKWYFVIISLLQIIGYYFLFCQLLLWFDNYLFDRKLKKINIKNRWLKNFEKHFREHPIRFSFLMIIFCWLIYIVAFYPLILSRDPSFQIKQYFNVHTKYNDYTVPLDPNVNLTAHHPVIHTLLLGGCIEIGRFFGSDNFGLFIYALIQITVLAFAFALSIFYLYKKKESIGACLILLLIYSLVPVFPMYAISAVKDTIYTALILFYVLLLFDFIEDKNKIVWWKKVLLFVVLFFLFLFRNNGIYIILLSMPLVIIYRRKEFLSFSLIFLMIIGSYFTYNKVLLPAFKITAGSKREMLSVPFQQTARYVKNYDDEIDSEEKNRIDQILGYDTLASRYNPELADPVKNEFNKYTTDKDLKEYFKVWFSQGLKHPMTYVGATLHNTYGYFYPNATNWYIYYRYNPLITEDHLVSYHYNFLKSLRSILTSYGLVFPYIPLLGLLVNIGFNGWLLLGSVVYLIVYKKTKYLICLMPLYVSFLICFVSPANTYFRYAMPYVFCMPFILLKLKKVLKNTK